MSKKAANALRRMLVQMVSSETVSGHPRRCLPALAAAVVLLLLAAPLCRAGPRPAGRREVQPPKVCTITSGILKGLDNPFFVPALAKDLTLLETMRRWEDRDWDWILRGATVLLLALFLWTEILRRRVRAQNIRLSEWAHRVEVLKNHYEGLFENASDVNYTTDLEGRITSISKAVESVTGFTPQEILGADCFALAAEEYREIIREKFKEKLQQGATTLYRMEILAKDGHRVPVEVNSHVIYENGKPVAMQGTARDISNRLALEKEVFLGKERLEPFFAFAPAGLAILDDQLRFIQINKTLAQMTGRSPQECAGKSLWEVIPKLSAVVGPVMQQVLEDGKPAVNYEHEGETPGMPGLVRSFVSSYFPIPALEGKGNDLAVICVEVTDRVKAERALQENRERLDSILSSMRDVVWSVTPEEHQVLYLNPATETIYGHKVDEFFHDPSLFLKTVHPDDRQQIMDSFHTLLEKKSVDQEFRIVRPDGEVRWLFDRSRPIRNSAGTIVRLDGICTDITDRRRMEEGLKLYREVFARSNEAVAILDRDYHFLEQNQAHRELLGYSDDELRKLDPAAINSEESSFQVRKLRREVGSFRIETRFRTRSGEILDVELSAFSIVSKTGKAIWHVGHVRDISLQKRTELERQRAREAAEAANRAKSEFLANMSHEIRTPLNGVLGMTELALNTRLSEEQREYLTLVKTSGETLLTVINDILDFSKIEAGRLEISPIDFELRDSLGDTLKSLSLLAHEKGLEVVLHVAHDVPSYVTGDPTRLRQVVVNLVGNAIKFTEKGEVVVHATVESQTEEEIVLHFVVKDTGVGIPADKQRMIFSPFTQADSSATRRYGGTGLGLAISFQLVELMGGRLWVESTEGKGSNFHFTTCFQRATLQGKMINPPENVSLKRMPALVVDDNATNRRLLEEILTRWGMKPAMADGGWTGLETMRRWKADGKPFPLVLIDALMPDMDGFTLAERIKDDPGLSGATIMMLTSGGRRGDAARCRKLGIAAYLHKPIKEGDLLHAVMLALSPQRNKTKDAELITRHTLREHRRNLRVLLAEDDMVNRRLAKRLLENFGYQVTSVSDGRQAVNAIQTSGPGSFGLVLMDIQMPQMDGVKATSAIRAMEKGGSRRLPIVAMTAHAMKGDRSRFLNAGMDGYISKPVQARELISVIEQSVQGAGKSRRKDQPKATPVSPIDWSRGLAAVEGDSELFRELLKLFAQETPAILDRLRVAVERKDAAAIELAAHTLKGSVSNFAADDATNAALKLEILGRQGNLEHAAESLHHLEQEIQRLMAAIETMESGVPG